MHGVYNDLPYLPEIIKIKKVGNVEHDKKGYVTHNKLKTTLNPILVCKKVNKIIKLNQKACEIIHWYECRAKRECSHIEKNRNSHE